MGGRLVFEDYKESWLSKFMSCGYSHDAIDFIAGVNNLLTYLDKCDKDTNYYIYVDTVPDNEFTVGKYMDIRNKAEEIGDNIFVLPIPCIEYYVLRAYSKIDRIEVETVIQKGLYKYISDTVDKNIG